jgi:endonuclease/exonuclease/phosphatase (EEP) superfamily protein YafD
MLRALEHLSFATVGALLLAAVLFHHLVGDGTFVTAIAHCADGYVWLAAATWLAWALVARSRARVAVALTALVLTAAGPLRGTVGRAPAGDPSLRVVTANLLKVNPDPAALLREITAFDADVYVFEEVTEDWAVTLESGAEFADYPYRRVMPFEGAFGIAVLSRVPARIEVVDLLGVPMMEVDLEIDGQSTRLFAVHALPPMSADYAEVWHAQLAELTRRVGASPVPVVVAGDLNATRHHPSYHRLLAAGLDDAHGRVGRGPAKTWPNGVFPVPSLRLDHVLVSPAIEVHAVAEGRGVGSDHLPVVADLGRAPAATSRYVLSSGS